jgi:hypothetical protein
LEKEGEPFPGGIADVTNDSHVLPIGNPHLVAIAENGE